MLFAVLTALDTDEALGRLHREARENQGIHLVSYVYNVSLLRRRVSLSLSWNLSRDIVPSMCEVIGKVG